MTYSNEIPFQSVEEIDAYQLAKLKETLQYVNAHSKYYQQIIKEHNINIDDIKTLEDIRLFPTTDKQSLQLNNDDFLCVPKVKIIDYITTSGTLGDPVTFATTDEDLERLAFNEVSSFLCAGCTEEDIFQLTTTMDKRFMAGLAYFLGARKLGAGLVRVGSGIPELQWDTIQRIHPTVLVAVPSFIVRLIEYAEAKGIDYKNSSIKKAICIGEPIRNQDFTYNTLGKRIVENWDIQLFSTYASTEMSAAFTECECGCGGHHNPDLLLVEFLDEHGQQVPEGEPGEVVITTLGVEGMPLLRFKTGDICMHYKEPCKCGRNTMRVGPVLGRKQHMIKFKGTTLYPPSLYDILDHIKEVENYVVEVSTNQLGIDSILIKAGVKNVHEKLEKEIKDHFRAKLRVAPSIEFMSPKEINQIQMPEMSRKPVKFFDKR